MTDVDNKVEVGDSESLSDKIDTQKNLLNKGSIEAYIKNDKPWYRVSHLLRLNFCIFIITLTSTNNGYDGSMLNGLQSLTSWMDKMGQPSGAILGALSNGTIFPVLAFFPIFPYLADKIGRKPTIVIGEVIAIIGAILQGLSTNYGFFLASRLVIGAGSGIAAVASPTLISEIAFPTHRDVTTASYNVCWYLGAIVAAWVTYGTRNIASDYSWRTPSYLQGFFPLVQLLFIWMVPESPRYLISKGEREKARSMLTKHHVGNSSEEIDKAFVEFEIKEIEAAIEMERLTSNSRYLDFVKLPTFRKRLFLVLFTAVYMQLSGNGLVSYYLSKVLNSIGITSATEQLRINGCLMIYNFVLSAIVAGVVNKFKRRTMFITSVSAMLFCYIIWTILSAINQKRNFEDKGLGQGVLAMIFFYYLSYDIGANGLPYLYITEILPYSHRAKGITIFQVWMNIVLIYNGFVNSIAMSAIEWKYYIVYCCILAVEVVIISVFYVETSGYTLEEVAKVFGDDSEATLDALASPIQKNSIEHVESV